VLGAVDFDGIVSLGTIPGVHNGLDMTAGCNFWGGLREVCLVPYRMETKKNACNGLCTIRKSYK